MLVYYFVPFIVSNRYLLFWVSNGHNSVTVQNRTHVYMNFFDHKDLGNHLLQLCPKVVKHPVYRLTTQRVQYTVNVKCYLNMTDNFLSHIVPQRDNYEETHLAQHAAPPYFVHPVHAWLDSQFCGWWIGLKDQQNSLCVISFWGVWTNEKI